MDQLHFKAQPRVWFYLYGLIDGRVLHRVTLESDTGFATSAYIVERKKRYQEQIAAYTRTLEETLYPARKEAVQLRKEKEELCQRRAKLCEELQDLQNNPRERARKNAELETLTRRCHEIDIRLSAIDKEIADAELVYQEECLRAEAITHKVLAVYISGALAQPIRDENIPPLNENGRSFSLYAAAHNNPDAYLKEAD